MYSPVVSGVDGTVPPSFNEETAKARCRIKVVDFALNVMGVVGGGLAAGGVMYLHLSRDYTYITPAMFSILTGVVCSIGSVVGKCAICSCEAAIKEDVLRV